MSESPSKSSETKTYTPPKSEGYIDVSRSLGWEWLKEDIELSLETANIPVETLGNQTVKLLEKLGFQYSSFTGLEIIAGHVVLYPKKNKDPLVLQVNKWNIQRIETSIDALKNNEQDEKHRAIVSLSKKQQNLEHVLGLMEAIFTKNENEWFGFIDETDDIVIDPGKSPWKDIPELQWKSVYHLADLQNIARTMIQGIQGHRSSLSESYIEGIDAAIIKSEEQYLDYVIGIGDKYEWGARAFHSTLAGGENVTQSEIESSIKSLVAKKSIPELFTYMIEKHRAIEANNYQSTEVTRTYSLWARTLNMAVLKKMKKQDSKDKSFLDYARIVSGRDVAELTRETEPKVDETWFQRTRTVHSLDTNLLDSESASEAILYVFQRPWGMMEKMSKQTSITDPQIESLPDGQNTPTAIVSKSIHLIEEKVEWFQESWKGRAILGNAGFQNVLDLEPGTTYESMGLEDKMKISILVRLASKLDRIISSPAMSYQGWYYEGSKWTIDVKAFGNMFVEIAQEGQQAVIDGFNKNLSWQWFLEIGAKDSKDFGFTGTDAEVFDLYKDIWWHGFFNPSDFSIERYKTAWQFWVVLIWSIGIAMITLPALASLGVLSTVVAGSNSAFIMTSSLASVAVSRWVLWERHDSLKEMNIDLVTDVVTAIWFWLIGWALTQKTFQWFAEWGKAWLSAAWQRHLWANVADLAIFWVTTELVRNYLLTNKDLSWDWSIEDRDRFSYENFHKYVKLNLKDYIS